MSYKSRVSYEDVSRNHPICHFSYKSLISYSNSHQFGHEVPEEVIRLLLILSVKSCHAALFSLFLILSIISTAFAVCIPKKIHRISVFLFHAFILESE